MKTCRGRRYRRSRAERKLIEAFKCSVNATWRDHKHADKPWRLPGCSSRRRRSWMHSRPSSASVPVRTPATPTPTSSPMSDTGTHLWRGQEGRFARQVRRRRNLVFYRGNEPEVLQRILAADAALGGSRPSLVWSISRKTHNRTMHALNGNTSGSMDCLPPLESQMHDDVGEGTIQPDDAERREIRYAGTASVPADRPDVLIEHPPAMGPPSSSSKRPGIVSRVSGWQMPLLLRPCCEERTKMDIDARCERTQRQCGADARGARC